MPVPVVIGHRGACGDAPENTLASIREAARQGAAWVEFDVKLTADGEPVLLHDSTLDRTTNGHGSAESKDLASLKALDAGAWFHPRFAGERIPTLKEAVALLGELGVGANVEIKACRGREAETGRVVAAALRDWWPASLPPPLLSSFSTASLIAARDVEPDFERALLVRRVPPDWRLRLSDLGCGSLHCSARTLNREQIEAVANAGVPLRCFTVNEPHRAELMHAWGVAGFFTNFPARLLEVLPA